MRSIRETSKISGMFLQDCSVTIAFMEAIQDDISTKPMIQNAQIPLAVRRSLSCNTLPIKSDKRKGVLHKTKTIVSNVIAETLWPTRCAICDKPGNVLCESCANRIKYIDVLHACPKCGSPFGIIQCSECNDVSIHAIGLNSFPFENLASAVQLDNDSKRLITIYKDHDEHRLAAIIARIMCRYINPSWLKDTSGQNPLIISFIPSTTEALRRRGFDHMEQLAYLISRYTQIKMISVFDRPRNKDQRKLGRKERAENMKKRFSVIANKDLPKRILLIDDICTTGSTLFGAAVTLKENGCEEVYGLTFGKVC